MILAQAVTVEQLVNGLLGAGGILLLKTGFDLWSQQREVRDRKMSTEQLIKQTVILDHIHQEQIKTREQEGVMTANLAVMLDRQASGIPKLDRIDRNVIQLKALAGIPDSETTITKKETK